MRRMLGWRAGEPAMRHRVVFRKNAVGEWFLRPLNVVPPQSLPYYEQLMVACGVGDLQHAGTDEVSTLVVQATMPVTPARNFIVRARGDSMDGGRMPIRDGDYVLCEWCKGASLESLENVACLVTAHDIAGTSEAMIKLPARDRKGIRVLRSTSGAQPDLPVDRWQEVSVVARVLAIVRPFESSED